MHSNFHPIKQHRQMLNVLYRLSDVGCIILGLWIASRWAIWKEWNYYVLAGAVAIILFGIVAEPSGIYRSWRGASTQRIILLLLSVWGGTLLLLLAVGYFSHQWTGNFSRLSLLIWFITTPLLMLTNRILVRSLQEWVRAKGYNVRNYAIVGATELGFQLARNIEHSPEMGLHLLGFFDDRTEKRHPAVPEEYGAVLGSLDDLVVRSRKGEVDIIYITFPMRAENRIRKILGRLSDTTASVYMVPDFFVFELLHCRWSDILGLPVVSIFETPFYGIDGLVKRACDFVLASILLAFLALPMAIIALAVKINSPGPIFFRQKRYGLDGQEINVWKFRSMTVGEGNSSFKQATKNDPRVTKVGAILRRTSLDELPQLFNVLDGSMSLVGPRPHHGALNEQFRGDIEGYMLRHKVKPGITGYAQVNGWRGETDTPDKMEKRIEFDLRYIREWSIWLDLKILFQTIFVVFSRKNAY